MQPAQVFPEKEDNQNDEGDGNSAQARYAVLRAQTGKPRHTLCCNLNLPLSPPYSTIIDCNMAFATEALSYTTPTNARAPTLPKKRIRLSLEACACRCSAAAR